MKNRDNYLPFLCSNSCSSLANFRASWNSWAFSIVSLPVSAWSNHTPPPQTSSNVYIVIKTDTCPLRETDVYVTMQRQLLFAYLSHPIHWSISSDKYLLKPWRNRPRFYLFRKLLHMLMQTKPYHQMRVEVHMPKADQTALAKTSVQTNLKIFYIFYIKVKVRDEQNFLRTW